MNFKTGVEVKQVSLLVQYGLGMQNIAPEPYTVYYDTMPGYKPMSSDIKNRVFSIGIGYSL